jgi:cell wall-associated NlpC family hydrolase
MESPLLRDARAIRSTLTVVGLPAKAFGALLLVPTLVVLSLSVGVTRAEAATQGDQIVAYAASQAGVPYCDGGGTIHGPTYGGVDEAGCGPGVQGFDCMSLVQYAVYQATGIVVPSNGTQPQGVGVYIAPQATVAEDTAELLPGDAVFWGGSINGYAHSGIYAGNGNVWDAIGVNQPVQMHTMTYLRTQYSYDGAMRFWTTGSGAPAPTSGALVAPVAGMASMPDGSGYWLTDAFGDVSAHGAAVDDGSMAGHLLDAPIAHIVSTSDGWGYWLVAADGGIFAFGDAPFYGSMGGKHLNAPVVGMAPTPDGRGYWLVAADGGIFAFGDAPFYGSMGAKHLNAPVVGMSVDEATGGYWEVGTDGGIFAFDAPFDGSTGAIHLSRPVTAMASLADGQGYWFVASDGGVFAEGSAPFHGSMGGETLAAPVVGMASDASTGGYWLVAADGGIFAFDAPFDGAD